MRRGFTLIELLVVVVIVGIVFSVLLPSFIGAQDKARRHLGLPPRPPAPSAPIAADLPELEAATLGIQIAVAPLRVGMQVYNRYEAHGRASLLVRSAGGPVRIEVPFPAGTIEARDVTFRLEGQEPPGVTYGADGVSWVGQLPVQPAHVEAGFVTRGGETFEYRLPPATRIRSLGVAVDLDGAAGFAVPDRSLQPSRADGPHLRWQVQNLVSDRPLVVDLPGAQSPLGRAMQLFQLAGVAVMLFGAGFWYTSDLRRPGLLKDFRWGHFLLLALNYCSFFVTFAVLEYHGHLPTAGALALALATSLPLLVLHVARQLGLAFALRDTLPLAAITIALTVTGVYGPAVRDYVFLAAALAATAFVTATYPRWLAARRSLEAPLPTEPEQEPPAPTPAEPPARPEPGACHCLACGGPVGNQAFCGHCGAPRPAECACGRCHTPVVLPSHLLVAGALELLHCPACGDRLPCAGPR